MRNKTWAIDMSVQIICEDQNHEKYFIKLNYSLKHNSIKKNMKKSYKTTYLIFKAYVCLMQANIYIHIQNSTSPLRVDAWRHVAQKDVYV